ncbi:hypothetical protein B0H11DRAFT_1915337 [Mycena galericulata]|nr:hypothetical protein B0H11DRAFT_1915337 [Mycena galericulata]
MSSIPTPTPPTPRTPRRRPFSPVASRSPGTPRKRVPPRSTRLQGYGKSLIFEAVAVLGGRKKVTIVICPLKAPEADRLAGILKSNFASLQVKQAGEKGISAIEINEDNANDPTVWRKAEKSAQLVYISPEMALSDHFGRLWMDAKFRYPVQELAGRNGQENHQREDKASRGSSRRPFSSSRVNLGCQYDNDYWQPKFTRDELKGLRELPLEALSSRWQPKFTRDELKGLRELPLEALSSR